MMKKTLSIIVPVYNEEHTIACVLDALVLLDIPDWQCEIIIADDGSTDGTHEIVASWARNAEARGRQNIRVVRRARNCGKGSAVRLGVSYAAGEAVLIQDADREYDPADIPRLLDALEEGVDAVFGSRNLAPTGRGYWRYVAGARLLTWLANWRYGSSLTDLYTGYKLVRMGIFRSCRLRSDGFAFEAEIAAELLARNACIREVSVSYHPRTFEEGKKIRAWDACIGVWTLLRRRTGADVLLQKRA